MFMIRLVGVIVLSVFFTACSSSKFSFVVEKRKHRSGYSVQFFQKNNTANNLMSTKSKSELFTNIETYSSKINFKKPTISDSVQTKSDTLIYFNAPSVECDLMTLKNGDEISCKVIEIEIDIIKYKRCDNLDGPLISVSKSDVFMIKYSNGTKEVIKSSDNSSESQSKKSSSDSADDDSSSGGSLAAIILAIISIPFAWYISLLGGILILTLALIIGIRSSRRKRR